jgi:hypothetical protein
MKTPANNNGAAQGTATAEKNNAAKNSQTVNRPSIPGKDKDKSDEPAKTEHAEPAAQASASPAAQAETTATEQKAATEQTKAEEMKTKPVLNLDQTLKAVDSLHRRSVQRLALIARIKTLEAFEVKLIEDHDELESNPYQGCKLIIEDDKRNQFVTNTPNLIRMVAQFVFDACADKLAEIESEIVFPNA